MTNLVRWLFSTNHKDTYFFYLFFLFLHGSILLFSVHLPGTLLDSNYGVLIIQTLGGSSGIYFLLKARNDFERTLCLDSFMLSSLSLCLFSNQPYAPFVCLIWLLARFVVPRDSFLFLLVLIGRIFVVPDQEWSLFFVQQIAWLTGFTIISRVNLPLYLSFLSRFTTLFIFGFLFILSVPLRDSTVTVIVKLLCPLSGALAIFFFLKARSWKENSCTFFFFSLSSLLMCLVDKNAEAAAYLLSLITFPLILLASLAYFQWREHPSSPFSSYFRVLINKGKALFFGTFYGAVGVLVSCYAPERFGGWTQYLALSLLLQILFTEFFRFTFDTRGEEKEKRDENYKRMNILRPLSPHLPIFKPQLTSTFPIFHRISGAFLATLVLFFYIICLKMGWICFTYENFYQFFFYSSKLILISVEITALALSYHLYNGVRHLLTDFSGFLFLRIGRKRLK